ncbi:3-phosphoinositide-dependent protein kinase 1-like [Scleropages formosus]|uniref:3-phosphoinositide-dependent protein kinase 1 n=1 Tax=Scleropages formosus TaxID=113540 RepID=A0A0P7U159_SCLFO|nr:3-phosphoinositide-dependent protein kinase 1-like [Scleropages formosus]
MVRNHPDSSSPLAVPGASSSHCPSMEGPAAESRASSKPSDRGGESRPHPPQSLQPRKKKPEDFRFGKILGEGSFSTVVLAREHSTGKEYAIKILEKRHIMKENKAQYVKRERDVMSILDHPFFVKLYFTFQDDEKLDLKPENILLSEDMHIQITDFGTAKQLSSDSKQARANSFVGTAQYVSPELLTEKSACKRNEYLIFQKIIKLEYEFPEKFFPKAKDLVEQLLSLDPTKRLGCEEMGGYNPLKAHPFFESITWENLHLQTPPKLTPYLPAMSEDDEDCYGNFSDEEKQLLLEKQTVGNPWHQFVENNLILKMGPVDKRKGLFARRRQLLLTEGPHLYYVDPVNKVLKGEIPWSPELRPEAKNFKTFFVHTPNRTYYLMDPSGNADKWCKKIQEVWRKKYQKHQNTGI